MAAGPTTANLTAAEEAALIRSAQAGDRRATETLLHHHDGWLRSLAHRKAVTSPLGLEDLHQEARLAFLEMLQTFDASRPERLNTAARSHVHGALVAASLEASPLPVPRMTYFRYQEAVTATSTLEEALEVATSGDHPMAEETFWAVHAALQGTASLASPLPGKRDDLPLGDTLPEASTGDPETADARERASSLLTVLEPLAREVVERAMGFRTGAPQKDADIAAAMGLSRPTVQRIRTRALETMRGAA